MAMWMGRNVVMGTHMGAEGAQWIGMAPFTDTKHIFQNMGDGTYAHSGSLAIRYCAGDQHQHHVQGAAQHAHVDDRRPGRSRAPSRSPNMVSELLANGVKKVIVTTDNLDNYQGVSLPGGTEVWHRDRLDEAQRALAATPGTTVLMHDQECAAELRRARSRGKAEEPVEVIVINERVCEGCGDCGVKSNCMSVEPVATEFGRKTRIHQTVVQQGLLVRQGLLPVVPDDHARIPEPAAAGDAPKKKKKGRIPALERGAARPGAQGRRELRLRHPRDGHRRHRLGDRRGHASPTRRGSKASM